MQEGDIITTLPAYGQTKSNQVGFA